MFVYIYISNCIYIQLVLDYQLVCLFWRRLIFSTQNSLVAYCSLCMGEILWAFPYPLQYVYFCLWTTYILVRLYMCSFCWLGDTLTQNSLVLLFLQSFHFLSCKCSPRLTCRGCLVDVAIGTGPHNFAFWRVVVFCNGSHLLPRDASLMGVRTKLITGHKNKYLECS